MSMDSSAFIPLSLKENISRQEVVKISKQHAKELQMH